MKPVLPILLVGVSACAPTGDLVRDNSLVPERPLIDQSEATVAEPLLLATA